MSLLEIILVITGLIVILISCFLVDRNSINKNTSKALLMESILPEDELKQIKGKIDEILSVESEETVVKTDDALSKISNEKIMAVNEFSDQVLEKISQNHQEVVFLYNMLNDKEKELKAAVREIDASKRKVEEIIEMKRTKESKSTVANNAEQGKNKKHSEKNPTTNSPNSGDAVDNNNERILSLYEKGHSVVEISKLLELGQGEVKLVIDLFNGKK
jgi:hypothetical protein